MGEGRIDAGSSSVDPKLIGEADIVIFALYPKVFKAWIKENQQYFKSGAYITDVTGVKGCIVREIQDMLRDDVEFISSHPMAGRETSGVMNSDDKVFYGANYIIVPTEKNTKEGIDVCREIGLIKHMEIHNVTKLLKVQFLFLYNTQIHHDSVLYLFDLEFHHHHLGKFLSN